MPIVNFTIPKALDRQVALMIKKKGFTSKAEFFRVSAMRFIGEDKRHFANEDEHLDYLVREIGSELRRFKGKKLPTLEEQLTNV